LINNQQPTVTHYSFTHSLILNQTTLQSANYITNFKINLQS